MKGEDVSLTPQGAEGWNEVHMLGEEGGEVVPTNLRRQSQACRLRFGLLRCFSEREPGAAHWTAPETFGTAGWRPG